ncbi:AAA family ATPase [Singulisphaera sp. Ch08]|uniref:AAA family ATPase n=1 Tax=Singulisphaera sp. Ch08 TaxID=3120278 RepID=A0AAU7CQN2_9BACT
MKISEVRIQNLRGYKDQTITFNDYNCLVGPNGAGKSTILCALCIFFRDTEHSATSLHCLDAEDFYCMDTSNPIKITVTFTDLNADAAKDFKEYYRQGKLIVTAIASYNVEAKSADVKQAGMRLVMRDFRSYFAADSDGKPVTELKGKYEAIRLKYPELPAPGTKAVMAGALRKYEEEHPAQCELVPSSDQFYGFSNGSNRLAKYLQWVYVPAVKDASKEQTEAKATSLGKLLARTVRSKMKFDDQIGQMRLDMMSKYNQLLEDNQSSLQDLSETLNERLREWAHPDARMGLRWHASPEKAIKVDEPLAQIVAGEGNFDGELSRFGHGLQRCYLLALLKELAGIDDPQGPRLILGCEEPELHQHPPQARHLADVLFRLSEGNSQVIVSTHSPLFITGERFPDVRLVRKDAKGTGSAVSNVTMERFAETVAEAKDEPPVKPETATLRMHQALLPALNELFFTKVVVLVEGLEDIAYLTTYFALLDKWTEFRRLGCHMVSADRKSNILNPLAITKCLGIPTFVVFDSDAHTPDNKNGNRIKHEKDNAAILRLRGYRAQVAMPTDTFWARDTVMWNSEIGRVVREEIGDGHLEILTRARTHFGNDGGVEKSALFIAHFLQDAWHLQMRSASLTKLCESILEFSRDPFPESMGR